jgi:alkanesulfonate monooxygenase SsuD/methylene tetrahydromethanopterin reductase-like flavin-dependent oxidoreductase (luciferase family)
MILSRDSAGELMRRFIEEADRGQWTLLPACLDDFIDESNQPFIELYRQAFERLGRPTQPIGVHSTGYVADTDDQAREEFWTDYKRFRDRIGAERGWPPIDRAKFVVEADRGALYVGSPDSIARKIAKTAEALKISRFDLKYSVGAIGHDKLKRSIELFGRKVVPKVRDMLV